MKEGVNEWQRVCLLFCNMSNSDYELRAAAKVDKLEDMYNKKKTLQMTQFICIFS